MALEGTNAPANEGQITGAPAPVGQSSDIEAIVKTLEGIDSGVDGETPEAKIETEAKEVEKKDEFYDEFALEREKFKAKKEFAERSKKLQEKFDYQQNMIEKLSQEIASLKGAPKKAEETEDDWDSLVKRALEDEVPANKQSFTPEEVQKLIRDEIDGFKKETEKEKQKLELGSMEKTQRDSIDKFVKENVEQFPLVEAFGQSDMVMDLIIEKWDRDFEQGGEEFALKTMLTPAKASQLINDQLASQMKSMLKSDPASKFLRSLLGQQPTLTQTPTTLSNSMTSPSSGKSLTEDERMNLAMNELDSLGFGKN